MLISSDLDARTYHAVIESYSLASRDASDFEKVKLVKQCFDDNNPEELAPTSVSLIRATVQSLHSRSSKSHEKCRSDR